MNLFKKTIAAVMMASVSFSYAKAGTFRTCSNQEILQMAQSELVTTRQIPIESNIFAELAKFTLEMDVCASPNQNFFILRFKAKGFEGERLVLTSNKKGL